jgi:hypothetical protein
MKYKGFVIKPVHEWDCKPDPKSLSGQWKDVKGKVIYYEILDPMEGGKRWMAGSTVEECKESIRDLLELMNMKDNSLASWEKLEGFDPLDFNIVDINELDTVRLK